MKKAKYEAKVKELEAARAKEKELSHKLLEEREQNPVSPIIQEEEKVLEMMENQEIPAGSGNRYRYLPAKQDDRVTKIDNDLVMEKFTNRILPETQFRG